MNIKINKIFPYLSITLLSYCLVPFFVKDTGSGMITLLILNPIIVLITSLLYSKKNEFNIIFSILEAVIFLITILTVLNLSAIIYILYYFIVSIIGSFIGNSIRKYQNRIR